MNRQNAIPGVPALTNVVSATLMSCLLQELGILSMAFWAATRRRSWDACGSRSSKLVVMIL
jgi:hypothetical protein